VELLFLHSVARDDGWETGSRIRVTKFGDYSLLGEFLTIFWGEFLLWVAFCQ
jgi:hypothetical protein